MNISVTAFDVLSSQSVCGSESTSLPPVDVKFLIENTEYPRKLLTSPTMKVYQLVLCLMINIGAVLLILSEMHPEFIR
jgi:hypothetical protein